METLASVAVSTALKSAIRYMDVHNLDAVPEALSACIRSWVKIKLPEALRDAKQALDANMGNAAKQTFLLSMAQAGIEAAKEATHPRQINDQRYDAEYYR